VQGVESVVAANVLLVDKDVGHCRLAGDGLEHRLVLVAVWNEIKLENSDLVCLSNL